MHGKRWETQLLPWDANLAAILASEKFPCRSEKYELRAWIFSNNERHLYLGEAKEFGTGATVPYINSTLLVMAPNSRIW